MAADDYEEIYSSGLSPEALTAIKTTSRERSRVFVFEGSTERNILVCGKSRSGKTTAIKVMKDPSVSPEEDCMFADKRGVQYETLNLETSAGVKYSVSIIDTPGLFETLSEGETNDTRTTKVILKSIDDCMRKNVTKLNLLLLFGNSSVGFEESDVEMIKTFTKIFSGSGLRIIFCVTRAENWGLAKMEQIRGDYKKHPTIGRIMEELNITILFVGCVKETTYYVESELIKAYKRVEVLRNELVKQIIESSEFIPVENIGIIKEKKAEMVETINKVKESFQRLLLNPEDLSLLDAHSELLKILEEYYQQFHPLKSDEKAFQDGASKYMETHPCLTDAQVKKLTGEIVKVIFDTRKSFWSVFRVW